MYRAVFWRSDAAAEEFGIDATHQVDLEGSPQLTYKELRDSANGDPVAHYTGGWWWPVDVGKGFSDVSIFQIEDTSRTPRAGILGE